jgi:type I restriction enzyme S subunit
MSVPALRFKDDDGLEFPEWEDSNLSKIAQIVGGGTPDTSVLEYWHGNIQWFTPTEIKTKYATNSQRTITESGLKNSSAKVLPVGTLLFSSRATVGDVSIAKKECTTNQGFQSMIVDGNNNHEFLYYWILRNKKVFLEKASGSTFLEISKKEIEKLALKRPCLEEQNKIANFLTAIDDKITATQTQLQAVKQYKQGLLQQIFSQELRFKDDDGRDFPEWEEKALSDVGKSFNGLVGKSGDDFGSGQSYITYKQIFDSSKIDVTKFSFVEIGENEKQNKVTFGDVFFTTSSETSNEVGFCSVLLSEVNDVYLNSFCFGYRINSFEILSPLFAQFLFHSSGFRENVIKLAQGSTRYNISKVSFMETRVQLPCIDEQTKIANFLTAIDDKITATQTQLQAVKQYKQGLLQHMFV